MADEYNIYKECHHCEGSGIVPVYSGGSQQGTDTCSVCNGEGKIAVYWTETTDD